MSSSEKCLFGSVHFCIWLKEDFCDLPGGFVTVGGLIQRVDVGGLYLNVKEVVSLIFRTPTLCQSKSGCCCLVYIYRVVD